MFSCSTPLNSDSRFFILRSRRSTTLFTVSAATEISLRFNLNLSSTFFSLSGSFLGRRGAMGCPVERAPLLWLSPLATFGASGSLGGWGSGTAGGSEAPAASVAEGCAFLVRTVALPERDRGTGARGFSVVSPSRSARRDRAPLCGPQLPAWDRVAPVPLSCVGARFVDGFLARGAVVRLR